MNGRRDAVAVVLTAAMVLTPSVAFAQETVQAPAGAESDEAPRTDTSIEVALPVVGDKAIYLLGEPGTVAATVDAGEPGQAIAGEVEFFDGEVSLGSTRVESPTSPASVSIETDAWPAGGARNVTAVFTPDAGSPLGASTSPSRVYRVVDTSRVVDDIELEGDAVATISDAKLDWTIANIWFSNFAVGFEREVLSGAVTLPEMPVGDTIEERRAYFSRAFSFSDGVGARDAAGNRVISYEGSVRLTSGTGNRWDFADPQLHTAANGDGYITAVFSGFYQLGEKTFSYGPTRVTIATFSGAELPEAAVNGRTRTVDAEIALNWEGQANGSGTWARDYDESFPNEFVSLLHPAIALFFARSSVSTDSSKIPLPITVSFTESTGLPFTDVDASSVHYPGIEWVYDEGITTGTKPTLFSPKQSVNRAQMALFLYRLAGEPEVKLPSSSPYPDVKTSDVSYKAIVWLKNEGLTEGVKKNGKVIFDKSGVVTRGQMAAFLYRFSDSPSYTPPAVSEITDVPKSSVFYTEINWLASVGVTTPYATPSGEVLYRPKNPVLREQMATFLHRLDSLEAAETE